MLSVKKQAQINLLSIAAHSCADLALYSLFIDDITVFVWEYASSLGLRLGGGGREVCEYGAENRPE